MFVYLQIKYQQNGNGHAPCFKKLQQLLTNTTIGMVVVTTTTAATAAKGNNKQQQPQAAANKYIHQRIWQQNKLKHS